ncbi:MAG: hypothetical protein HPY53_08015 [Brevinematales bacterium]|nr:hypothetical protein [Brevinematales bacterium]
MISEAVKTLRRNQGLLFLLFALVIVEFFIFIALGGVLWINKLSLWFVSSAAVFAVAAAALIVAGVRRRRDMRDLVRTLEIKVFGARRLVLDSYIEFRRKGIPIDGESDVWQGGFARVVGDIKKRAALRMALYAAASAVFLAGILLIAPPAIRALGAVDAFLRESPGFTLPVYYIREKPLLIDLTAYAGNYDKLALKAADRIIESADGVFTIGAELTAGESLDVTVLAEKYGIERPMTAAKLIGTTKLLPNRMSMTVVYPFKTEEYPELQDIEVWAGGKVIIGGNLTKEIKEIRFQQGVKAETGANGSDFRIAFYPSGTMQYSAQFVSSDGDFLQSPEFTVKTLPNTPPTLKLLYPVKDIVLGGTKWSVMSLVEAEDDQGIVRFEYHVTVTNSDPYLSAEYGMTLNGSTAVPELPRYLKKALKFDSGQIDLLPGDVAVIDMVAVDPFGAKSPKVTFQIISPDLSMLMEERIADQKTLKDTAQALSNTYSEFQKDLANNNLAGANQKMKEMDKQVQKIKETAAELQEKFSGDEGAIQDIKDSMTQMKEITEKLSKQTELMKKLMEYNQKPDAMQKDMAFDQKQIPELLKQLKAMLKNLEYYQKFSEMLNSFKLLENTYDLLKETDKDNDKFQKTTEAFQKQLGDMKDAQTGKMSDLSKELLTESKQYKMGDQSTFEKSDSLMSQMKNAVKEMLDQAGQNQMKERMNKLQAIIEELFLDVLLIREADSIELTQLSPGVWGDQPELVEKINALDVSTGDIGKRIDEALDGLVFKSDTQAQIAAQLENHRKVMDIILASIRDKRYDIVKMSLDINGNYLGLVSLYLMKVNAALEKQMQNMQQGQNGQEQQMSMKMDDLVQMQGMMSQSLQSLMQQLQQNGQMTPGMKQMMEQLASLQKEIQDNLKQMMGDTGEGIVSGGQEAGKMMDDIIKGLQSYQVDQGMVEKSKQIEEKLLDSQKSLQSKGISEEREAEQAKVYQPSAPKENDQFYQEKIDLSSIPNTALGDYYKKLIQKYMSGKE